MIGKILSALIGAEVERTRRQSPVKGAMIGAVAASAMRRMGPLGLVIGGVYVARKLLQRGRDGAA